MLVCALGSEEGNTLFPQLLNIAYQWAKLRATKEVTIEEKARETLAEGISEIERNKQTHYLFHCLPLRLSFHNYGSRFGLFGGMLGEISYPDLRK